MENEGKLNRFQIVLTHSIAEAMPPYTLCELRWQLPLWTIPSSNLSQMIKQQTGSKHHNHFIGIQLPYALDSHQTYEQNNFQSAFPHRNNAVKTLSFRNKNDQKIFSRNKIKNEAITSLVENCLFFMFHSLSNISISSALQFCFIAQFCPYLSLIHRCLVHNWSIQLIFRTLEICITFRER